jgi:hypothetical protein
VDRTALFVVTGLALTACTGSPTVDESETKNPALHDAVASGAAFDAGRLEEVSEELIEMARVDQEERSHFGDSDAGPWNDEERTARLVEIVDEYGWPAPDVFGVEAASAAWLIAQHSDADPGFQQRALSLLSEIADYPGKGEHVALLTDRVSANTGEPQVYGSQIGCYGVQPIPDPDLGDPDRVDEFRAEAGLEPLADYLAHADQNCVDLTQIPIDADCRQITGATLLLKPNPVILVGEIHGTNESPAFVGALTCIALSYGLQVTVGLEIPARELDTVEVFLRSDGGVVARRQLLESSFWASDHSDGRQSTAMADLLNDLREHIGRGADLEVLLLDASPAPDRDAAMARRLLDRINSTPEGVLIALTGNVHSSTALGTSFDSDHEPMGYLLRQSHANGTVIAIDVRHAGGTAWVCLGDGDCGPTEFPASTTDPEQLDVNVVATVDTFPQPNADGFHGTYYVGELSPAEPAAEGELS